MRFQCCSLPLNLCKTRAAFMTPTMEPSAEDEEVFAVVTIEFSALGDVYGSLGLFLVLERLGFF